ncbi:hypothetical protein LXA43DRAFT_894956, partial [Ganoderma leucocontextum]
ATNYKDEFPQMTLWLEHREKVLRHDTVIQWHLEQVQSPSPQLPSPPPQPSPILPALSPSSRQPPYSSAGHVSPTLSHIHIAKTPNVAALCFDAAISQYGATFICDALARFVVAYRDPSSTSAEIERQSKGIFFRFATLPTFHKLKFILEDAQHLGIMENTQDAAHAHPARKDKQKRMVPARFDTVLVNDGTGGPVGVQGYRVGRLWLIFKLPKTACRELFPDMIAPGPLAYVDWFTDFGRPNSVHGLYEVRPSYNANGERLASIVEITKIRRSCHLFSVCHDEVPRGWTSTTVLDLCNKFWVNCYSDMHMYMTLI